MLAFGINNSHGFPGTELLTWSHIHFDYITIDNGNVYNLLCQAQDKGFLHKYKALPIFFL